MFENVLSSARDIAYRSLIRWENSGIDPHDLLEPLIDDLAVTADRSLARELFLGVIRWRRFLDHYIDTYSHRRRLHGKLRNILRLGFYQLLKLDRIPPHAAVFESVELTKKYAGAEQAALTNAVLRAYLKEPERVTFPDKATDPVEYLGLTQSYPDWLVNRYLQRFGLDDCGKLLEFGNKPAPVSFFVNSTSTEPPIDLNEISAGIENVDGPAAWKYYIARDGRELLKSPQFAAGRIIIGDPSAGMAPTALNPDTGSLVLDLCASPGGKSAALSMLVGDHGRVTAIDVSFERLKKMKTNCRRWDLKNVDLAAADLLQFATSRKFKYILLDVPCSGTGTMRRNPDLRWRLRPDDIERLADYQAKMLKAASHLLDRGGRLVYSTCSIEPEENELQIERFIGENPGFRMEDDARLNEYRLGEGMYATFPTRHGMDGAFAAIMRKSI